MNATRRTHVTLATSLHRTALLLACGWAVLGCGSSRLSSDDGRGANALRADDDICPLRADRPPHVVQLWPPNHKFHLISIEQCLPALTRCEPDLDAEFSWASSDEPIDGLGDGHHAPDLFRVDREHVCVRSERQGPKDGRVYRLGVSFIDADDRIRESECLVVIDHDQRGIAARDDGEQYQVEFDDAGDLGSCGGAPGAPPRDDTPPRTPDEPGLPVPPDAPEPGEPEPDEPGPPDEPEDVDGPR